MRVFLCALVLFAGAALGQAPDRSAALDRAYEDVKVARAQLEQAQAARERGEEPLPGERLGVAGGKGRSRLSDEYWARQARLVEDVQDAQRRLDEALANWNALR
jgi:hypothetical protein